MISILPYFQDCISFIYLIFIYLYSLFYVDVKKVTFSEWKPTLRKNENTMDFLYLDYHLSLRSLYLELLPWFFWTFPQNTP